MKKYCSFHKCYHNISEFAKNRANKDGYANICRSAKSLYNRGLVYNNQCTVRKGKPNKKLKDYIHYSAFWHGEIACTGSNWKELNIYSLPGKGNIFTK